MRLHHLLCALSFVCCGMAVAANAEGNYARQALSTAGGASSQVSPSVMQASTGAAKPASKPASKPTDIKTLQAALINQQNALSQQAAVVSQLQQRMDLLVNQEKQFQHSLSQQESGQAQYIKRLSAQVSAIAQAPSVQPAAVAMPQSKVVSYSSNAGHLNGFTQAVSADWQIVAAHKSWVGAMIATLLLLTGMFLWLNKRKNLPQTAASRAEQVTLAPEEEFDYLSSEEGMVAKLDLARAYEAMQDYAQMREVLDDVIKNGDSACKQQAQVLLDGIPNE